jgi:hypothetical protein
MLDGYLVQPADAETNVVLAGKGSVILTLFAAPLPLLRTVRV